VRAVLLGAVLVGAVVALPALTAAETAPVTKRDGASLISGGYLPRGSAPDSLLINPPPPAEGSAALARDEEAAKSAVALRGTPRFAQATLDADLFSPSTTDLFSCAAGFAIGPKTTPRLVALLRKAGPDLAMAVYPSKRRWMRPRPFMVNGQPTCTPQDEPGLRRDGSYPSGHSAIGYGWGLLLAEAVPDRAGQLVARGIAFGDSRRVCNVHWLSDVEQGRAVAAAVVARLHAVPAFRTDMAAASAEVARLRARAPRPDFQREDAALATP
jgi:acid phosphatase (class A)